jgi:hypothetical protein
MKKLILITLLIALVTNSYAQTGKYRKGIFLHHSTGGCIWGPNGGNKTVPNEIAAYNSSHNFTGSDAFQISEAGWPETPWDNEWYRWHNIFENKDSQADIRPFYSSQKIIIIKSCYPSSSMTGWGVPADTLSPTRKSVYNYKWHWRSFIAVMKAHPECLFVIWTNAPLESGSTNASQASISSAFCKWAKDTLPNETNNSYGAFPKNVYVFDFFHKLADATGILPSQYSAGAGNSHPNGAATNIVAPQFAKEVLDAALAYEGNGSAELAIPVLTAPLNNSVKLIQPIDLKWNLVNGADSYYVQLSEQNNFNTLTYSDTLQSVNSYTVNQLKYYTKFYWRVRAKNANQISAWSEPFAFTTEKDKPSGEFAFTYPADQSTVSNDIVVFRWSSQKYAENYEFALYDENSKLLESKDQLTDTSYQTNIALVKNKSYFWKVRAGNSIGTSSWSKLYTFFIDAGQCIEESENQINIRTVNYESFLELETTCDSKIHLNIFDYNGKIISVISDFMNSGKSSLCISEDLQAGVYFLNIYINNKVYRKMFVRQ